MAHQSRDMTLACCLLVWERASDTPMQLHLHHNGVRIESQVRAAELHMPNRVLMCLNTHEGNANRYEYLSLYYV